MDYIRTTHPFWNRTQGRDHLLWFTLDQGACSIAHNSSAEAAIKLVHFGYSYSGGAVEGPLGT